MLSNLRNTLLKCTAAALLCTIYGQAIALEPSKAATNAEVFFIEPKNGAEITGPATIKFGIKNMTVIPAGVQHPYSGHHHLLIDVDKLPDLKSPIPADANHRHFGKGQTEVTLELGKVSTRYNCCLAIISTFRTTSPCYRKKSPLQ